MEVGQHFSLGTRSKEKDISLGILTKTVAISRDIPFDEIDEGSTPFKFWNPAPRFEIDDKQAGVSLNDDKTSIENSKMSKSVDQSVQDRSLPHKHKLEDNQSSAAASTVPLSSSSGTIATCSIQAAQTSDKVPPMFF